MFIWAMRRTPDCKVYWLTFGLASASVSSHSKMGVAAPHIVVNWHLLVACVLSALCLFSVRAPFGVRCARYLVQFIIDLSAFVLLYWKPICLFVCLLSIYCALHVLHRGGVLKVYWNSSCWNLFYFVDCGFCVYLKMSSNPG